MLDLEFVEAVNVYHLKMLPRLVDLENRMLDEILDVGVKVGMDMDMDVGVDMDMEVDTNTVGTVDTVDNIIIQ